MPSGGQLIKRKGARPKPTPLEPPIIVPSLCLDRQILPLLLPILTLDCSRRVPAKGPQAGTLLTASFSRKRHSALSRGRELSNLKPEGSSPRLSLLVPGTTKTFHLGETLNCQKLGVRLSPNFRPLTGYTSWSA
jgi:hypothetical protein